MKNATPQQEAVIEWFRSGRGDLCVTARAGSGKSTTLLEGTLARPADTSAMLCAFGKRIADDLGERLQAANAGSYAKAKTLHGIGFRAISRAFARRGARISVNHHREFAMALDILGGGEGMEDEARSIGKLAALAKETRPDDITPETLRDLAIDFGLADTEDEDEETVDVANRRAKIAMQVVDRSLDVRGEVSYADMLWLPLVKKWSPDQTDLVVVDEAQDLGLAQLRLAAKVRRAGGRIVVCGDNRQAIYSWRGAAPGALERVADGLRAQRLSLTVTFRCATAIVDEARKIVPDLQAAPGAKVGAVRTSGEADLVANARPGDFVLSRTNAPLAQICLKLIRAGTPARIVGSDLGPELIRLVRRMSKGRGTSGDELADLLARLITWRDREVKRATAAGRQERADYVSDLAAMVIALSSDLDDVISLFERLEDVFTDDARPRVTCSSIHRAKGLEADRVWILEETLDKVRGRTELQEIEEANLRYVAITRARNELIWTKGLP